MGVTERWLFRVRGRGGKDFAKELKRVYCVCRAEGRIVGVETDIKRTYRTCVPGRGCAAAMRVERKKEEY
jgi:hypothetical protein